MKCTKARNTAIRILESVNMAGGTVLAPGQIGGGGEITNGDTYAPGDNRLPKPLFKKPIKRKPSEIVDEDFEEAEPSSTEILELMGQALPSFAIEKIIETAKSRGKNGSSYSYQLRIAHQKLLKENEMYKKAYERWRELKYNGSLASTEETAAFFADLHTMIDKAQWT